MALLKPTHLTHGWLGRPHYASVGHTTDASPPNTTLSTTTARSEQWRPGLSRSPWAYHETSSSCPSPPAEISERGGDISMYVVDPLK